MIEEKNNVYPICGDCVDDERENFQRHLPIIEKEDFVKATFVDDDAKAIEHMWVKVENVIEKDGKKFIKGELHNAPSLVQNVKYLDKVEILLSDCWGHIKGNPDK